jgi:hypothetical protein
VGLRDKKKQENNEYLGALVKYYQVIRWRKMRRAGHVTSLTQTRHAHNTAIRKHDEKTEDV